ncbi:MAG: LemA family protein [Rikenellaceae bacterium]|jgi:LemA protein|nr:LemA family protein [Rikenellaceae bacterium]
MKKGVIILIVLAALALILYLSGKGSYNNMVKQRESVKAQWSNVENQYQRRADLIPNLVNTVKGYAEHEQTTLESVMEARSKATQIQLNADQLTPEAIQQYSAAQGEISSALGRLMAVAEAYPDLKANQNFRDLQVQLEGTENRIATERRKFNEEAQGYNAYIQQFPRLIWARLFNFDPIAYFTAEAGSERAPVVEF